MDLPPDYQEWAAPEGLRHAVVCLWSRVTPLSPDRPVVVLPDACSDLIWQAGVGGRVAGPDTHAWHSDAPPAMPMIGVRFRPGAGGPALRTGLDEIRDRRLGVEDLLPGLRAGLDGDLTPAEALARLLHITRSLVEAGPPDRAVQAAATLLDNPRLRLDDVTEQVGLSSRQLRRRCQVAVGYGPKTLQRVLRLRGFLDELGRDARADLAHLAYRSGYADQAHLTRECTQLTGMTPLKLAAWQHPPPPLPN